MYVTQSSSQCEHNVFAHFLQDNNTPKGLLLIHYYNLETHTLTSDICYQRYRNHLLKSAISKSY